jgi:DNA-binding transcriptional MocR family regulator
MSTQKNTSRAFAIGERYIQISQLASNPARHPSLSGLDFAVLKEMNSFTDLEGGSCYPSLATLAARTRHSRSTVVRAVQRLRAAGLLEVVSKGQNATTRYRINVGGVATTPPSVSTTPPSLTTTPPSVRATPPQCQDDTTSGVVVSHEKSTKKSIEKSIEPITEKNTEVATKSDVSLRSTSGRTPNNLRIYVWITITDYQEMHR